LPSPDESPADPDSRWPEFSVPRFPDAPFHPALPHEYKRNHSRRGSAPSPRLWLFPRSWYAARHWLLPPRYYPCRLLRRFPSADPPQKSSHLFYDTSRKKKTGPVWYPLPRTRCCWRGSFPAFSSPDSAGGGRGFHSYAPASDRKSGV